jgi:RimJ/RimL family protein N-acetyltransferase
MHTNLYTGQLVRLSAEEPQVWAKAFTHWSRDTEYIRLLDDAPAQAWSVVKRKQWLEKEMEDPAQSFLFGIRTQAEDQLIGFIGLGGIQHPHGDTWLGIGIGDRNYWSKGYGSEAMQLLLCYAFTELNLHRVSLGVFAYNTRARRAYEKCGFKREGVMRQVYHREGQRWDLFNMGILRAEWLAQNGKSLD